MSVSRSDLQWKLCVPPKGYPGFSRFISAQLQLKILRIDACSVVLWTGQRPLHCVVRILTILAVHHMINDKTVSKTTAKCPRSNCRQGESKYLIIWLAVKYFCQFGLWSELSDYFLYALPYHNDILFCGPKWTALQRGVNNWKKKELLYCLRVI